MIRVILYHFICLGLLVSLSNTAITYHKKNLMEQNLQFGTKKSIHLQYEKFVRSIFWNNSIKVALNLIWGLIVILLTPIFNWHENLYYGARLIWKGKSCKLLNLRIRVIVETNRFWTLVINQRLSSRMGLGNRIDIWYWLIS